MSDDQLAQERVEAEAATGLLTGARQIDDVKETVCRQDEGEYFCTTKASFCESSPKGDLNALSRSSTSSKLHSRLKKVEFVSIKNTTTAPQSVQHSISVSTTTAKAFNCMGNDSNQTKKDMGDSLASLLTTVNTKDSLI